MLLGLSERGINGSERLVACILEADFGLRETFSACVRSLLSLLCMTVTHRAECRSRAGGEGVHLRGESFTLRVDAIGTGLCVAIEGGEGSAS